MTPLAKFWRTFAAGMVGTLGAIVLLVQAANYSAGLTLFEIGVATAALSGGVAAALAWREVLVQTNPLGKAVATFLQYVATGLGVVTFTTVADIASFPHVALPILGAAVVAGLQTYFQTSAEAAV